jgi:hypothetical protein
VLPMTSASFSTFATDQGGVKVTFEQPGMRGSVSVSSEGPHFTGSGELFRTVLDFTNTQAVFERGDLSGGTASEFLFSFTNPDSISEWTHIEEIPFVVGAPPGCALDPARRVRIFDQWAFSIEETVTIVIGDVHVPIPLPNTGPVLTRTSSIGLVNGDIIQVIEWHSLLFDHVIVNNYGNKTFDDVLKNSSTFAFDKITFTNNSNKPVEVSSIPEPSSGFLVLVGIAVLSKVLKRAPRP